MIHHVLPDPLTFLEKKSKAASKNHLRGDPKKWLFITFLKDLAKIFSYDFSILGSIFLRFWREIGCQLSASRAPVEDLSNYGLPAIIFQAKIVCIHLGYEFRVHSLFFSVLGIFLVFFLEILCQLECQLSASRVPVCVPDRKSVV